MKYPKERMRYLLEAPGIHMKCAMKYLLKVPGIHMKSAMKYPRKNSNEGVRGPNEIS